MTKSSVAFAAPRAGLQSANVRRSLDGSIPTVLLSFAAPSLVQISVQSAVAVIEVILLSRLGTDTLAGISTVFPIITLSIAITTVGMGGAVSSAIARSLGAGKTSEAEALAVHAILLSLIFGAISAAILIGFGPGIYRALGAKGASLDQAVTYSNIVFGGSVSLWLLGGLTGVVRGTADMRAAAKVTVTRAIVGVPLIAILIFGMGPIPGYGIIGAAAGMLIYYTLGILGMVLHLQSAKSPIHLTLAGLRPQWNLFARILKVAVLSSTQLVVTNVMLIVITAFVARFGIEALAGYGLASRLEILLSSLVLAFGIGTTTMVGTCVGADLVERARRVTWVSCALAAAVFATLGLGVAVSGRSIAGIFTSVEAVVSAGAGYFRAMGLVYGFMAVSVILFSAYQGWGRPATPLVVSLLRLVVVVLGGWVLMQQANVRLEWLYYLIASSVILAALGLGSVFLFRPPTRVDKVVSGWSHGRR